MRRALSWCVAAILVLAGLAVLPVTAQEPGEAAAGKTYCVAPDGKPEGDGSREKPFGIQDLLKAVKLEPGDEIVFLDGVYGLTGSGINVTTFGTAEKPITYRAENRHKAILDGGTPIAGWQKVAGREGIWEARVERVPRLLLVNGDGIQPVRTRWRRDGKETLDEGLYAVEKLEGGGAVVLVHPWAGKEPQEAYGLSNGLMNVSGAFNVVDGFLLRRSGHGIHLGGKLVHTYRMKPGIYQDLCGLVHNLYGSFNIVRHCIVRDTPGQGMTSNESRFNLIEDCVIYNAGNSQGCHGIYISQGAENLTLRRNVWWRTSGGAIHIYSGSGIDSPRNIVVEYNIFGPDKRNRCFPINNRKSTALYIWGGRRWAGHNRIAHNIIIGPYDRGFSMHKCSHNVIAHNIFLNTDGAPMQFGSGYGNLIANNIVEYSPGGEGDGFQTRPAGYHSMLNADLTTGLSLFGNNLLLPRGDGGKTLPAYERNSRVAAADPFVDRANFDFRLKPDSKAVDMGIAVPGITGEPQGAAPDVGALEIGEEQRGPEGKFPEIPRWLLAEWPLSKRGE